MPEGYKHAKNNSSPRVVDYLCFVQLQWSCVLADVALADVALKAWYMRLQSINFSELYSASISAGILYAMSSQGHY